MDPDYSKQLEQLIAALSHKGPISSWVISVSGVVAGVALTMLMGSFVLCGLGSDGIQ